ncbi:MAG TPA: hypothetical protein VEL07_18775 [Planctomycetota bacterium]|nr:hypothetical protein [Planctomycetota bacterium]
MSLVIATTAVVTAAMVFPTGVKAQQAARFRLYAASKAMEICERNACANVANPALDHEACAPWDVGYTYRSQSSDLETKVSGHRFGMHPLPVTIARRLDSDEDEIQRLLDDGGYLYYFAATGGGSWREDTVPQSPPDDAQRVIVGVQGYAQNNAVNAFPLKAWPYSVPYPSPPTFMIHGTGDVAGPGGAPRGRCEFLPSAPAGLEAWQGGAGVSYLWEAVSQPGDADLVASRMVFTSKAGESADGLAYGYKPYFDAPSAESATRYLQAALWWCERLGAGALADFIAPSDATRPIEDFSRSSLPPHKQVLALRYLAHAGLTMTRWFPYAGGLDDGVAIPSALLAGQPSPELTLTHELIVFWHATSLHLAHRFAASYPYDWGAPRPLERAIMTDYPLFEYDLFAPPIGGTIAGSTTHADQWRLLTPQPVKNLGRSMSYPGFDIDNATWTIAGGGASGIWSQGDPTTGSGRTRFSLCAPFAASERCRQLVFWAVDWMSYEDAETAPSAPVDASKYPKWAPIQEWGTPWDFARMMNAAGSGPGWSPDTWVDHHLHTWRNPEKQLLYTRDMAGPDGVDGTGDDVGTGSDVTTDMVGNTDWSSFPKDQGAAPEPVRVFNGLYGADRNFNHRLDRGPLPRTTRLRAQTIGRWNYYDTRVHVQLR